MIGFERLKQLAYSCETALIENIPGDFVECGIWRGGATILMRAILHAYADTERTVWGADSFEGLPKPTSDADAGDQHHTYEPLKVSLEQVTANFQDYGFGWNGDKKIKFLKGWFAETLPNAPIEKISVLRADGDMYGSTMDILNNLYHKVSPGGFVIIDDFNLKGCHQATLEFRRRNRITSEMRNIDNAGIFWRKE